MIWLTIKIVVELVVRFFNDFGIDDDNDNGGDSEDDG